MINNALALIRLYELEFGLDDTNRLDPDRAETERERCRAEIDQSLLARYERLKTRFGAGALAEVVNGICSACRISLPKMVATRLKNNITFCDHCGRILYSPENVYHFGY